MKKIFLLLLHLFFASALNAISLDVEEMIAQIMPAQFFPSDLPDEPMPVEITRNTVAIGIGAVIATVTIPDIICGGTTFPVTVTLTNTAGVASPVFTTVTGLLPTDPNVTFVAAAPSVGTFAFVGTSAPCPTPGTGTWTIGAAIPPLTTFTITVTGLAAPVAAPVALTMSTNASNPGPNCIVGITATIVPSPVANNFVGGVCNNTIFVGTLTETGGTPPFNFSIVTPPPPSAGVLVINDPTTGSFTFTPTPGFAGVAAFTFDVTDANGCVSNLATGNITVGAIPVALPLSITDCTLVTNTGTLAALVSGGTPPYTFSATAVIGGTLVLDPVTGAFAFTIAPGFSGTGGFTYLVTDSNGCVGSNTVSVTFLIAQPNVFVGPFQVIYTGLVCG